MNYFTFISESRTATIPCINESDSEWAKIAQSEVVTYNWYNITDAEVNPELDFRDLIKDNKNELKNGASLTITYDGQLSIKEATLDITGFYLCLIKFGSNVTSFKSRYLRHLIKGLI